MHKVGVTGGIGSGKSVVSHRFAELGAYVFDADVEAKKLIQTNATIKKDLAEEFGNEILDADGSMNLKKLAQHAFASDEAQAVLNAIVHPFVFEEIESRFTRVEQGRKTPLFVVDAALIYESGLDQHLDYVILVTAQYGVRMQRALQRGSLTREEIQQRMNLQFPEETKISMADFVINNNGTEDQLIQQIDSIYRELI